MKTQDELLSRIAQTLPPDRGQEAFDLSMKIQDEADAAYAGGVVLSRWVENQPDKALSLVDQVLAYGRFPADAAICEGWAAGDFPGFLQWVQQGDKADVAIHLADIVARNALMAGDYELAARNAWAMGEDEDGSRADLLETLRGIPDQSLPVPEGKP